MPHHLHRESDRPRVSKISGEENRLDPGGSGVNADLDILATALHITIDDAPYPDHSNDSYAYSIRSSNPPTRR